MGICMGYSNGLRVLALSVAGLSLTVPAFASTTDYFQLTDNTSKDVFTFSLPSSPTPDSSEASGFTFLKDVSYMENGTSYSGGTVDFFSSTNYGGLGVGAVETQGAQVFMGTTGSPTFVLGTYQETGFGSSDSYTLIISDTPISPTPEPSSLALLGTGVLGFAALVGRGLKKRQLWGSTI